jgi:Predicted signal-transduction protein containing cAMP-binding and CBS domains
MRVGELCNREVVVADRSMSVPEGARLMRQHHVGDLVIVEEHGERCFPVGIVTDRDLVVEVLANNLAPETLSLGDIMTFDLITAREDDDPLDIIKRMLGQGHPADAGGDGVGLPGRHPHHGRCAGPDCRATC